MAKENPLPDYYQTVLPYLILNDVQAFLEFTKKAFGAEEKMKHTDEAGRIVHENSSVLPSFF